VRYRQKTVYNLKEIENLGAKAGVIINTVKDVLQSLLDDNLVDTDKIGAGNFYWAFLSKAQTNRERRLEALEQEIADLKNERKLLQSKLEEETKSRQQTEERQEALDQYAELQTELAAQDKELEELRKTQPEYAQECVDKAGKSRAEGNRYTDEIFAMMAFMKKTMMAREEDIKRQFGLPEELDYE
jgi:chromosome segregation ATPase